MYLGVFYVSVAIFCSNEGTLQTWFGNRYQQFISALNFLTTRLHIHPHFFTTWLAAILYRGTNRSLHKTLIAKVPLYPCQHSKTTIPFSELIFTLTPSPPPSQHQIKVRLLDKSGCKLIPTPTRTPECFEICIVALVYTLKNQPTPNNYDEAPDCIIYFSVTWRAAWSAYCFI